MMSNGFKINEYDKCVYMKDTGNRYVILCLYVDDMLTVASNEYIINTTKKLLNSKFDMKDMELVDVILGIHLSKNKSESISLLEYSRVIGSLMYLMSYTRPDIAYAVSKLSRYTTNPRTNHWKRIVRVLKYLYFTRS